jgi:hypothetical protein
MGNIEKAKGTRSKVHGKAFSIRVFSFIVRRAPWFYLLTPRGLFAYMKALKEKRFLDRPRPCRDLLVLKKLGLPILSDENVFALDHETDEPKEGRAYYEDESRYGYGIDRC